MKQSMICSLLTVILIALFSPVAFAGIAEDVMAFQTAWTQPLTPIPVGSNDPATMLQVYGQTVYPSAQAFIRYLLRADTMEIGSNKIATVRPVVGVSAVINAVRRTNASNDASDQINGEMMRVAVRQLVIDGAVFGYDGMAVNACGAPTVKLLILDVIAATVYSIDLEPCDK